MHSSTTVAVVCSYNRRPTQGSFQIRACDDLFMRSLFNWRGLARTIAYDRLASSKARRCVVSGKFDSLMSQQNSMSHHSTKSTTAALEQ
jgi:hypothetical protein